LTRKSETLLSETLESETLESERFKSETLMSEKKLLTAAAFFEIEVPAPDARLEGEELSKVFWAVLGRAKELARQEAFWAATNAALADAYRDLEARSAELRAAREELVRLNGELEARVAEQVGVIVGRAKEIEALNVQLQEKVLERSRELAVALRRLSGRERGGDALEAGQVLAGRVEIDRLLGSGGAGNVYLGTDLLTGQQVAVKVLHADLESDPTLMRRFVGEVAAAAAITYPGIIKTLHIDVTTEGRIFQIMEYVEGTDLASRRLQGPLASAAVARIGAEIARALAAAHAIGVIHRDIKPSNVILCASAPGIRVLDFGISKITVERHRELYATLTRADDFVGTPQYSSPEQIDNPATVTPKADVYSLGVLLYEMLGPPPFAASGAVAMLLAHIHDVPLDVRLAVPDVPEELATLLARCLAKSPDARPTATELADALSEIADTLHAPPASGFADVDRRGAMAPVHEPSNTLQSGR
jgi:hypothetical protein